jgi:iron complex transport system ATP-binding protein
MTARTLVLSCRRLAFGYGSRVLGIDLDLDIAPGELVALVGPNGAGKTSLLRTIAGIQPILAGEVLVEGDPVSRLSRAERARRVSVLPQQAVVHEDLTVEELVALGRTPYLTIWGRLAARDREAISRAIALCELEPLGRHALSRLSGGERQRARIALALAQETALTVLDEPTTHLDLKHRAELFRLLSRIRTERRAALLVVLHDLAEAFRVANRVFLLGGGQASEVDRANPASRCRLAAAFEVDEGDLHY